MRPRGSAAAKSKRLCSNPVFYAGERYTPFGVLKRGEGTTTTVLVLRDFPDSVLVLLLRSVLFPYHRRRATPLLRRYGLALPYGTAIYDSRACHPVYHSGYPAGYAILYAIRVPSRCMPCCMNGVARKGRGKKFVAYQGRSFMNSCRNRSQTAASVCPAHALLSFDVSRGRHCRSSMTRI